MESFVPRMKKEIGGGRVQMTMYEGSGHFPPLDARERWEAEFFGFLESL